MGWLPTSWEDLFLFHEIEQTGPIVRVTLGATPEVAQEKRRWRHLGNTALVVELHCVWLTNIFTQLSRVWNFLSLQTRLGILSLYSLAVVGDERWSL